MRRPPALLCQVEDALARTGVSGGIVAAVSGGPDSVALLRALRDARGVGPLVAAHLNHQLRGPESDADEAFVRDLCAGLAVPCRCQRLDVRTIAVAEGATWRAPPAGCATTGWRKLRPRRALALWRRATPPTIRPKRSCTACCAAPACKGSVPSPSAATWHQVWRCVRPLLTTTRADVMAYLNELGQAYRQDSTNFDPTFTRNRIRHQLLPLLAAEYNPEIVAVLARLAAQADETHAAEEERARALLAAAELPRAGAVLVFDGPRLWAAPLHQVRPMFRLVWQREGWPMDAMGFDAWQRVAAVARGEATAADLPGGVRMRCAGRVVQVGRSG